MFFAGTWMISCASAAAAKGALSSTYGTTSVDVCCNFHERVVVRGASLYIQANSRLATITNKIEYA